MFPVFQGTFIILWPMGNNELFMVFHQPEMPLSCPDVHTGVSICLPPPSGLLADCTPGTSAPLLWHHGCHAHVAYVAGQQLPV